MSDNINSASSPHLLGIPREIRDEIYSYLVQMPHSVPVLRRKAQLLPFETEAIRDYLALSLVCRQLSSEADNMFFARNVFEASIAEIDWRQAQSFPLHKVRRCDLVYYRRGTRWKADDRSWSLQIRQDAESGRVSAQVVIEGPWARVQIAKMAREGPRLDSALRGAVLRDGGRLTKQALICVLNLVEFDWNS